MADKVKLSANARTDLGKGASGRLRRDGRTPAVVYGREVEPLAVHVDALDLYHALHTPAGQNVLIELQVDGQEHLTLPRDIQRHPVRGDVQHVDFLAVSADQKITVEVPVHLVNTEHADKAGVLNLILGTIPVLVTPLNVPQYLELDVTGMEIGDVRRAEDLAGALPEGAELDIDPERTILTVNPPDIILDETPEEEEEELEPELIGEDGEPIEEGAEEGAEEGDEAPEE